MLLTYSAAIKTYRRGWNSAINNQHPSILFYILETIVENTSGTNMARNYWDSWAILVAILRLADQLSLAHWSYAQEWTHKQNTIVKLSQDRHTVDHALECSSLNSKLLRFWCFPPCPGTAGPSWPHWKWRELKKDYQKIRLTNIHKYRFELTIRKV